MESRTVTKVGSVVILALLVFGGLYLYLSHINPNTYKVTVTFEDTLGVARQSIVRMRGVAIGEVADVTLDQTQHPQEPKVTLAIKNRYKIPKDSHFVIVSGLLITTPQILIKPSDSTTSLATDNTATADGDKPQGALASLDPKLDEAVQNSTKLVNDLQVTLKSTSGKLNDVLDRTKTLLDTTNKTVSATQSIVGDPALKSKLLVTLQNFQDASGNAKKASDDLRVQLNETIKGSRGNLDKLTAKLNEVLDHVDVTIDDTNSIVKKLTEQVTDPRLQNTLQETAELARATLSRFNQIASDIHELSGDPNLQANLKSSVANLQEITEKGRGAAEKVDTLLNKFITPGTHGPRLPKIEVIGNVSEALDPTRLRVDVDARIPYSRTGLVDIGLYDLGQNTRLNLQAGNYLFARPDLKPGESADSLLLRYGLYASKLGGGLDYDSQRGYGFRADLWDTNRPRLDAKVLFRVKQNASVWLGADNLLRTPVPIIGFQIKQ
jgi:phospholipid/cholesterol/gamma-HCH transport system substrate-binding protein